MSGNVTAHVYEAEHEVCFMLKNGGTVEAYGSTMTLPIERRFGDLDGVQRYVNLVWEACDGPGHAPRVRSRAGDKFATYWRARHEIAIPLHQGSQHSWAMREMVVLHELAHTLTSGGHGPDFCATFLSLVNRFVGPEVRFLLYAAFCERGVQIGKSTIQ